MTMSATSTTQPGIAAESRPATRAPAVRRALALTALGVAAVTLAACGSSSASTTSTTASPSTGGSGQSGGSGPGGGGPARQLPGASGSIAAINGTSLEVQNPSTGQTTVTYTPATTFDQTVSTAASSVTVGTCISAFGKPTSPSSSGARAFGEPVTATTVSITQPASGTCTGFGGSGGFGRRGSGNGSPGRPAGGFGGEGGGTRPAGGNFRGRAGGFGGATGTVTAVNGSTVTVDETDPATKKTSSVTVTLTSSTTFTERTTASSSDLAVGKCANAIGSASSTGAVTARSIVISTPGANGCTAGFEGFRGGVGEGTGAGSPGA
jgi:Domain of unknown function (DUF5666)